MLPAAYPWIKALHLVAAVTFVSGALASALVLSASAGLNGAPAQTLIGRVRRRDGRVTTPAMAITWAIGLGLELAGHWFSSPWQLFKLAFVGALSALHGVVSARLRMAEGGAHADRPRWVPVLVIGSAAAIVIWPSPSRSDRNAARRRVASTLFGPHGTPIPPPTRRTARCSAGLKRPAWGSATGSARCGCRVEDVLIRLLAVEFLREQVMERA